MLIDSVRTINYFYLAWTLFPFQTCASVGNAYIQRPHLINFKALKKP